MTEPSLKIGFDAKRAFFNATGLGNFSRGVITGLVEHFPVMDYYLYSPAQPKNDFYTAISKHHNVTICKPHSFLDKQFPSFWRSFKLSNQLIHDNIDIFHGLSAEIPAGINDSFVKSICTVHDLIFERYPNQYTAIDRAIYRRKMKNAVKNANKIIAISEQTKADLVDFYHCNPSKIEVIYQSIHPIFYTAVTPDAQVQVKEKYQLNKPFLLCVGTIETRKNQLNLIKAFKQSNLAQSHDLVLVGKAKEPYFSEIKTYLNASGIDSAVRIIHTATLIDLHQLYGVAEGVVYPSIFEGFGIPVVEAIAMQKPVLVHHKGCFSEAAGKAGIYTDVLSSAQLAKDLVVLATDAEVKNEVLLHREEQLIKFNPKHIAQQTMQVYEQVLQ